MVMWQPSLRRLPCGRGRFCAAWSADLVNGDQEDHDASR